MEAESKVFMDYYPLGDLASSWVKYLINKSYTLAILVLYGFNAGPSILDKTMKL